MSGYQWSGSNDFILNSEQLDSVVSVFSITKKR